MTLVGQRKEVRAVAKLIEALDDPEPDVATAAAKALVRIGDPALKPLIRTLSHQNSGTRLAALKKGIQVLNVGVPGVHPLDSVAKPCADALAQLPLGQIPAICNSFTAYLLASALAQIGTESAIEVLVRSLESENEFVRETAAKTLRGKGWHPPTSALAALFSVECHDWNAAINQGDAAIEPLVRKSRARYGEDVRLKAAHALAQLGDVRAIEPLMAFLRTPKREDLHKPVYDLTVQALVKLGDPGLRAFSALLNPELNRIVHEQGRYDRFYLVEALGRSKDRRALPFLLLLFPEISARGMGWPDWAEFRGAILLALRDLPWRDSEDMTDEVIRQWDKWMNGWPEVEDDFKPMTCQACKKTIPWEYNRRGTLARCPFCSSEFQYPDRA